MPNRRRKPKTKEQTDIDMFEEKFNVPDQPFVRRILKQGPF